MLFHTYAAVLVLAPATRADVFRSALQYDEGRLFASIDADAQNIRNQADHEPRIRKGRRNEQTVFLAEKYYGVEIWDAPFGLLAPAAVGNPPQPFRMMIDLTWDTLFVPSSTIDAGHIGDSDGLRFSHNESSTYTALRPNSYTSYAGVSFGGNLALDTFRIAGVEIARQPFLNAETARSIGWVHLWIGFDGALGLSPRWNTSLWPSETPSPLAMMVSQGVLDSNLFAIDVPRGPKRRDMIRTGEISFGGINPAYDGSRFSVLPLTDYTNKMWTVTAQSITWENETHPIHEDFQSLTLASLNTDWFIGLPLSWSEQIHKSVQPTCGSVWCFVDCEARSQMPNLTFGLAGQTFTITPFEYAPMLISESEQRICSFEIYATATFLESPDPVLRDSIILGTPFLSAFYSVFDLDQQEIRLANSIRKHSVHD